MTDLRKREELLILFFRALPKGWGRNLWGMAKDYYKAHHGHL